MAHTKMIVLPFSVSELLPFDEILDLPCAYHKQVTIWIISKL